MAGKNIFFETAQNVLFSGYFYNIAMFVACRSPDLSKIGFFIKFEYFFHFQKISWNLAKMNFFYLSAIFFFLKNIFFWNDWKSTFLFEFKPYFSQGTWWGRGVSKKGLFSKFEWCYGRDKCGWKWAKMTFFCHGRGKIFQIFFENGTFFYPCPEKSSLS